MNSNKKKYHIGYKFLYNYKINSLKQEVNNFLEDQSYGKYTYKEIIAITGKGNKEKNKKGRKSVHKGATIKTLRRQVVCKQTLRLAISYGK